MPEFELLVKPLIDSPGNATAFSTPGLAQRDLAHPADHFLGAIERGAVGQLREADQVLLVLLRHETARHGLENSPTVAADQDEVDPHHQRLARQHAGDAAAVGARAGRKSALKPRKNQPSVVRGARQPSFGASCP